MLAELPGAAKFANRSSVRTWLFGILKHKVHGRVPSPDARGCRSRPTVAKTWPMTVRFLRPMAIGATHVALGHPERR